MSKLCNPDSCSTIGVLQLKIDVLMTKLGKQMQWVSVNDRLPNFNGKIIACIGCEKVMGCSFNNDAKEFFHIQNIKNVTHWMPLPEPPKGEE